MLDTAAVRRWLGPTAQAFAIDAMPVPLAGYEMKTELEFENALKWVRRFRAEADAVGAKLFCGALDVLPQYRPEGDSRIGLFIVDIASELDIIDVAGTGVLLEGPSPDEMHAAPISSPVRRLLKAGNYTVEQLYGPSIEEMRRRMQDFLLRVYKRHPFKIHFLDRKGLFAPFDAPLKHEECDWVITEIAQIDPDAFCAIGPSSMEEYLLTQQALRLWWD